jgi:hypothetical protein
VTDLIGTERLPLHDRLYLLLRWAYSGLRRDPEGFQRILETLGLAHIPAFEGAWMPLPATRHLLLSLPQAEIETIIARLVERAGPPEDEVRTRPLTWEMLARMQAQGVTIGSHTRSHALLTRETEERLDEETAGSRGDLALRLGIRIDHFAYPDGHFACPAIEAVKRAGYSFAYTTCRHRDPQNPLLTIPRQLLWERSCVDAAGGFSPAIMACSVRGVFDVVSRCRQQHWVRGLPEAAVPRSDPSRAKHPRPAA